MYSFPTRIKDIDLKILMELDDKSLFNACSTDTYTKRICEDEHFWRNRFVKKFGQENMHLKSSDKSWKNYYLQIIIDLERSFDFLHQIVWKTDINDSYFKDLLGKLHSLKNAPEWVLNNLYFLNFGDVKLSTKFFQFGEEIGKIFIIKNATPYNLFKFLNANMNLDKHDYIDGIKRYFNSMNSGAIYVPLKK